MDFSRSFELRVQSIKTFEAFGEDLLVVETLLGPTLKDLLDSEPINLVELVVLQICIVDEFSQLEHCAVTNPEPLDQGFESAGVPMMAEFHFEHVVGYCAGKFRGRVREDEFCLRIDELTD